MTERCDNCKHCEVWNSYQGCYCNNEEGIRYLCDVAEFECCKDWEAKDE